MTRVLPLPAPARMHSGPDVIVTASRWAGSRSARRASASRAGTAPSYRRGLHRRLRGHMRCPEATTSRRGTTKWLVERCTGDRMLRHQPRRADGPTGPGRHARRIDGPERIDQRSRERPRHRAAAGLRRRRPSRPVPTVSSTQTSRTAPSPTSSTRSSSPSWPGSSARVLGGVGLSTGLVRAWDAELQRQLRRPARLGDRRCGDQRRLLHLHVDEHARDPRHEGPRHADRQRRSTARP